MNNQNNLNNQTNQEQTINFGTNLNDQPIPEINNQIQNNSQVINTVNVGVNNQQIPEMNNNSLSNNIPPQKVNVLPEVKIPSVEVQTNSLNQNSINNTNNQVINNIEQTNTNNVSINNDLNNNQPIINTVNVSKMEKKSNKKLLIVLLIIIVSLVIGIPVLTTLFAIDNVTNTLDETRKSAYLSSAKTYIYETKDLVRSFRSGYYIDCISDKTMYMSLAEIEVVENETPFGNKFQVGEKYNKLLETAPNSSYVKIEVDSATCEYKYYIYITDGLYSIGTVNTPVLEEELDITDIK